MNQCIAIGETIFSADAICHLCLNLKIIPHLIHQNNTYWICVENETDILIITPYLNGIKKPYNEKSYYHAIENNNYSRPIPPEKAIGT